MQEEQYIIPLPLSIVYNKKGDKFYLNLNQYRNTHFHTLNTCKVLFKELVQERISHIPRIKKLDITYTLFTGSKRSVDLANICSIVDKFFCDTLVESNVLIDDGLEYLSSIDYRFGSIDKNNPRVEATLHNIEYEKEEEMKIILTSDEVIDVLKNHIRMIFNLRTDQPIGIAGNPDYSIDYTITLGPPTSTPSPDKMPAGGAKPIPMTITNVEDEIEDKSGLKAAFDAVPVGNASKEVGSTTEANSASVGTTEVPKIVAPEKPAIQVEAPSSVIAPKSLFSNLTKPDNSKAT